MPPDGGDLAGVHSICSGSNCVRCGVLPYLAHLFKRQAGHLCALFGGDLGAACWAAEQALGSRDLHALALRHLLEVCRVDAQMVVASRYRVRAFYDGDAGQLQHQPSHGDGFPAMPHDRRFPIVPAA